jgi:membrane fusion protein, heavy metal efflux system
MVHMSSTTKAAVVVLTLSVSALALTVPSRAQDINPVRRDSQGNLVVDPHDPLMARLTIAPVIMAARPQGLEAPGEITAEPARTVSILPPLAGHIVSLDVVPGDRVRRGQVLALIASGDMAQASSDEAKARSALKQAQAQYRRARNVVGAGGGAIKDLESAQAAYEQAAAELDRASARLAALGRAKTNDGALIPLTAPIDAVVATVSASAGMNITDPTAVLITLVDISELWVTADLSEDEVPLVQGGLDAQATLPVLPGVVLHGTLGGMPPVLQSDTRRLPVHFIVDNPRGVLRPNMYAHVTIALPTPPQIMVPQTALLMNNDATTVLVEVRPGVFARRSVDIVYDDGANSRVLSGLSAHERIVTQGAVLLNDD